MAGIDAPASVVATDVSVAVGQSTLLAPTSFTLEPGGVLALTGPNGAGKTTLLRAIAGRAAPSSGTVMVAGSAPNDRDPAFRARLAALLGSPPLARNLTLHEHLVMVAASWGLPLEESEERAEELLGELMIMELSSRFPHELSSGQIQLFALALTLARPFQVLLLDEPEQHLDADRLSMVEEILRARAKLGTTIVMASHGVTLVERLADEVLALADGNR